MGRGLDNQQHRSKLKIGSIPVPRPTFWKDGMTKYSKWWIICAILAGMIMPVHNVHDAILICIGTIFSFLAGIFMEKSDHE